MLMLTEKYAKMAEDLELLNKQFFPDQKPLTEEESFQIYGLILGMQAIPSLKHTILGVHQLYMEKVLEGKEATLEFLHTLGNLCKPKRV